MFSYFFEVAHLILRYFHVIAGIAWIGASFYFIWLDNNLSEPPQWKKDKGIKGDLWAVHGGGFYEVAKYSLGPEKMPSHLHWFKWEAYTTFITGALLLTLLYYVGADAYLMDASKTNFGVGLSIGLSILSIVIGLIIYEALCRSSIADNGRLFVFIIVVLLTLWTWGLDQFLSDRAAYIHVGALIGTCMAANVFTTIIPGQRYLVNEIAAGRVPEAGPGLKGKQRSVHNNYATLPVIFIMLSNHFAFTYSHAWGWLVLIALFVNGLWLRHYFNLKHQGQHKPSVLISAVAFFFVIMLAIAPWHTFNQSTSADQLQVSDAQVWEIISVHCTTCHATQPSSEMFSAPPSGFIIETIDQAKLASQKIHSRAIINKDMPLGNLTAMTEEERELLALWLRQL